MRLFSQQSGPDGWVATDATRGRARWVALLEYPHLVIGRALRRQKGVAAPNGVPCGANDVLERLAALPVSVWTYGFDDASVRHMGPMSQDFAAAFGLGCDDRTIDLVDANGVVMAACQALYRRVVALEEEVAALRRLTEPNAADAADPE